MYYVQFESLITLDSLEIWQIAHSLILHITISNHNNNFCSFTKIHFGLFQRNSSIPTTASLLERGFMQVFHLFLSRNSLTGKILICPGLQCWWESGFIYFLWRGILLQITSHAMTYEGWSVSSRPYIQKLNFKLIQYFSIIVLLPLSSNTCTNVSNGHYWKMHKINLNVTFHVNMKNSYQWFSKHEIFRKYEIKVCMTAFLC